MKKVLNRVIKCYDELVIPGGFCVAFLIGDNMIEYEVGGEIMAEVSFPAIDAGTVDICHTYVDDELRGQGIAASLMACAANALRKTNRKAVLTCTYAVKWFGEHPEFADILRP